MKTQGIWLVPETDDERLDQLNGMFCGVTFYSRPKSLLGRLRYWLKAKRGEKAWRRAQSSPEFLASIRSERTDVFLAKANLT